MNKLIIDTKTGEQEYVPLTPAELAALQPSPYQLAMQDWHELSYNKRIVAAVNLLDPITPDNDIYIKFYTFLKEKGFPIHSDGDVRYIYVNEISINHTTFIDNDSNIIIEDKPKQEDYE